MTSNHLVRTALAAGFLLAAVPAFAAEGAATGSGTSTPAGPAGDNSGPTKSSSAMSSSAMSSGGGHSHMKKMKHHHHTM